MSIVRMPANFGPTPGPRQRQSGGRWSSWERRATSFKVSYLTDPDAVQRLLPPGFRVGDEPRVTVRAHFVPNIPWMGGRGYNYVEVMFDAVFDRGTPVAGDFTAVMWEGHVEPIFPGREEVGHPKVFAEVPEPISGPEGTHIPVLFEGFELMRLTFPSLDPSQEHGVQPKPPSGAPVRPRLNYRYFPQPGNLTEPEVESVLAIRPVTAGLTVVGKWEGEGSVVYTPGTYEQLPMTCHIVEGLATLVPRTWEGASMVRTVGPFDDCIDGMEVLYRRSAPDIG